MSPAPPLHPDTAWLRLSDELVSGIHHALNNRMAALAAVAQVLEGEIDPAHPLRSVLQQEVERLQATVGLLTLLPRAAEGAPQAIRPADVLQGALDLYRLHHDLRDIPCEVDEGSGVPPVRVEPGRLTHALLHLLGAAGAGVRDRERAAVWLRLRGTEETVTLEVEGYAEGGAGAGCDGNALRAAQELMREFGADVECGETSDGNALYTLRIPALRARRP